MITEFETVKVETLHEIPDGYRVVRNHRNSIEVIRPDGFTIFLHNEDTELMNWVNNIRLFSPRLKVIQIVSLVHGMQISKNYAKRYAPDLLDRIASDPIESIKLKMIQNYHSIIE